MFEVNECKEASLSNARSVVALQGDLMAIGCGGELRLTQPGQGSLLWEAEPALPVEMGAVVDLRGRLECAAKDEAAIPSIFQLPPETINRALLLDQGQRGGEAERQQVGAVAVPPGATTIDLSDTVPPPTAEEQPTSCEQDSGRVCIFGAAGGIVARRIPVPLLSPDTLAHEPGTGALLVGGGTGRVLGVIPRWDSGWVIPVVLDRSLGQVKGATFPPNEPDPTLRLLLAAPEAQDPAAAAVFSASSRDCTLELKSFRLEWPKGLPPQTRDTADPPQQLFIETLVGDGGGSQANPALLEELGGMRAEMEARGRIAVVEAGSREAEAAITAMSAAAAGLDSLGARAEASILEMPGSAARRRKLPITELGAAEAGPGREATGNHEDRLTQLESGMRRVEGKLGVLMRHLGCPQ